MGRCVAVGCNGMGCYKFPSDVERRRRWEIALGRPDFITTKHSRLCSSHFKETDFQTYSKTTGYTLLRRKLKKSVVPSIFTIPMTVSFGSPNPTGEGMCDVPEYSILPDLYNKMHRRCMIAEQRRKTDLNFEQCRICLLPKNKNFLVDVLGPWPEPWAGMEATVACNVENITGIKIEPTEPRMVCSHCLSKLKQTCEFATTIKHSHHVLKERWKESADTKEIDIKETWPQPIQLEQSISNSLFESSVEVKQEPLSDDEIDNLSTADYRSVDIKIEPTEYIQPTIESVHCNGFTPHIKLKEELLVAVKEEPFDKEEVEKAEEPLECLLCTKRLQSVSGLKAHVIAMHSYRSVRRRAPAEATPPETPRADHHCSLCELSFPTQAGLSEHETSHRNDSAEPQLECAQQQNGIAEISVKSPETINHNITEQNCESKQDSASDSDMSMEMEFLDESVFR